jgi:hypothetical protein
MAERGVGVRYAQEIAKRQREAALAKSIGTDEEPPQSQKNMVLAAIYRYPFVRETRDLMSKIRTDNKELRGLSDTHHLAHVLWSLQRQGLVQFFTKNRNGTVIIQKFRLTTAGEKAAIALVGERPAEKKLTYPDPTDFRNYGQKASGGPIERFTIERPPVRAEDFFDRLDQNEKPYFTIVDEARRAVVLADWTKKHGSAQQREQRLIIQHSEPTTISPSYPLIEAMLEAGRNILEAAALLRKAGQNDLATMAEEQVKEPELLREIAALWKEAGR